MADMVLLPSSLKAFIDAMLDVKVMLRTCALITEGWRCDREAASIAEPDPIALEPAYPRS